MQTAQKPLYLKALDEKYPVDPNASVEERNETARKRNRELAIFKLQLATIGFRNAR